MLSNKQQLEELKKCRKDPVYFLDTYGFIKDVVKGKIRFKLFDYHKALLRKFIGHVINVIKKPRHMGNS